MLKISDKSRRLQEKKIAKKEWKKSLDKDTVNFQKERSEMIAYMIDVKSKSKGIHSHEISNVQEVRIPGMPVYFQGQYQGYSTIGYASTLTILN